jgi:hypothetical protein
VQEGASVHALLYAFFLQYFRTRLHCLTRKLVKPQLTHICSPLGHLLAPFLGEVTTDGHKHNVELAGTSKGEVLDGNLRATMIFTTFGPNACECCELYLARSDKCLETLSTCSCCKLTRRSHRHTRRTCTKKTRLLTAPHLVSTFLPADLSEPKRRSSPTLNPVMHRWNNCQVSGVEAVC